MSRSLLKYIIVIKKMFIFTKTKHMVDTSCITGNKFKILFFKISYGYVY